MNKAFLVLFVLILILGGTFAFIYFKYQRPLRNPEISKLSISAQVEGRKVITGVILNGQEYNTSNYGYIQIDVPKGYILSIENKNLEDQRFYLQRNQINISQDLIRYDFILKELQNLSIKKISNNPIELEVFSEDFEDLNFCLKWSLAYIFVRANYTEISTPNEFRTYDRCYSAHSLKGDSLNIQITYQELSPPKDSDFIEVVFFNPSLPEIKKIEKVK